MDGSWKGGLGKGSESDEADLLPANVDREGKEWKSREVIIWGKRRGPYLREGSVFTMKVSGLGSDILLLLCFHF